MRKSLYLPFIKEFLYFSRELNSGTYQMPRLFPQAGVENLVISVTERGAAKEFSALITNVIPDLEMISKGQCFPLYLYEKTTPNGDLYAQHKEDSAYERRDAITGAGLVHFQTAYPGATITKEGLLYYIYGLLHSEDYRQRYADNFCRAFHV